MSGSKGGVLILAVAIFGAGYLAAPEVRTVTETKTDIVTVRIPDTHVIKDTKVVTEPLPESCNELIQASIELFDATHEYARFVKEGQPLIKEGRKALATGEMVGTTKPMEDLSTLDMEIGGAAVEVARLESNIETFREKCESDQKK